MSPDIQAGDVVRYHGGRFLYTVTRVHADESLDLAPVDPAWSQGPHKSRPELVYKVADMADLVALAANLAERVEALDARLEAAHRAIGAMGERLDGIEARGDLDSSVHDLIAARAARGTRESRRPW